MIGLGFKAEADGRSVSPDSMFIVQELCAGGALRDVVAQQMCSPRQVRCCSVTHGLDGFQCVTGLPTDAWQLPLPQVGDRTLQPFIRAPGSRCTVAA